MTPSKDKPKKVGTPINPPNLPPVVGVGASVGGLDSFKRRSINEDQESTNEELQSANEELAVLNQELISLNEQVRAERDYFESIIATIAEPLLVLDKNLRVKSANSAFYKTFQVNEAETEAKLVYELGNNQWDIPKLRALLENILPEKTKFNNFEVTHQFQYIGQRVMMLNAREIKRENEQNNLSLLTIEDITERKEAEYHRSRLSALVDSSDDAIISKTLDGIITTWNNGAEQIFGYKAKEAIGKHISILIPKRLLEEEDMIIGKIKKNESLNHYETQRLAKDGTNIDISLTISPIKDKKGKIIGASKIARDISQQIISRKKIEESEENFRQLAELMPDKICIADSEGTINYINRNWLEFTTLSIEGVTKSGWLEVVHSDDLEKSRNYWGPSIGSLNTEATELRLLNKNGEYTWHLCRISAVKDKNGKTNKWIVSATEIQQQKLQEEGLEKSVMDGTQQLLHANKTLEQKNVELGRINKELEAFTYVSSHDLQEPLRKIQTFAERIMQTENEVLSLAGRDYFDRILITAERMKKLIEDLLAFSRINNADWIFETVNLDDIIEQVKIDLKESIEEKRATIRAKPMCKVRAIPFQFHQLMHNIISNALKYSKLETPPHIIIKGRKTTCDKTDDAQLKFGKVYCHISISDNGIGFDPGLSNRIFKVFQQLHRKDEYAGTGIGLAIVKKIVECHNGFIRATGELGKGATFDIYIPE